MASWPTKELKKMEGHVGPVWAVHFNAKGNYCLSGGQDRSVKLWNPFKGSLIQNYKEHSNEVLDLCIAHDNSHFTSVGCDRVAIVWDVATSDIRIKYRGHSQKINTVCYNEEGNILVTGSYDKTVKLWDLSSRSREAIQTLEEAKDSITSVLVRGYEIFSASVDGCVRTYDVRMGKLKTDHTHHPITSLNVSHDGNCLLLGCLDHTIRLLDKESGDLLNCYTGHKNNKYSIKSCFSYDDAVIVSGSEDNSIYIWDLVECKVLSKLSKHTEVVGGISYHPSSHLLLSCSVDGKIRLWGKDQSQLESIRL